MGVNPFGLPLDSLFDSSSSRVKSCFQKRMHWFFECELANILGLVMKTSSTSLFFLFIFVWLSVFISRTSRSRPSWTELLSFYIPPPLPKSSFDRELSFASFTLAGWKSQRCFWESLSLCLFVRSVIHRQEYCSPNQPPITSWIHVWQVRLLLRRPTRPGFWEPFSATCGRVCVWIVKGKVCASLIPPLTDN